MKQEHIVTAYQIKGQQKTVGPCMFKFNSARLISNQGSARATSEALNNADIEIIVSQVTGKIPLGFTRTEEETIHKDHEHFIQP